MREAVTAGQAVVALESALITHGLPWPRNLETARASESSVRGHGAIPATIALLDGMVRVGLDDAELEEVARAAPGTFLKANRRDLGMIASQHAHASTTVAATLWCARAAGIGVMATGGLGGVHRDASQSWDVSNDLDELRRADGMLVVCSGCKSILDVPATLEWLETHGVPVVGYRTSSFPSFVVSDSDLILEHVVQQPIEAARAVDAHRALGLPAAIVLAQAVPQGLGVDRVRFEQAMTEAQNLANATSRRGKAVTPFLLDVLRQRLGESMTAANIALIVANAALAAEVATAIANSQSSRRLDAVP